MPESTTGQSASLDALACPMKLDFSVAPVDPDGEWGPPPGMTLTEWRRTAKGRARWGAFVRAGEAHRNRPPPEVLQAISGNVDRVPRGDVFKHFLMTKGDPSSTCAPASHYN